MLNQETINTIARMLKLDAAALNAAISAEEEAELPLPDNVTLFTTEELEVRDKSKKDEGIRDGRKLAVKEAKEKTGLSFEENSMEKFIAEFSKKIEADARLEPSAQVAQLKQELEQLQGKNNDYHRNIQTLTEEKNLAQFDAQLISMFPTRKSAEQGGLSDMEYLTLIKSSLQFERTDDGYLVKNGGQVLRETATQDPLSVQQAITDLFRERQWNGEGIQVEGRGGGNSKLDAAGKPTKMSEARTQWEKQKKDVTDPAFAAWATQLKKENPQFDTRG